MKQVLLIFFFFFAINIYSQTVEEFLNLGVDKLEKEDYNGAIRDFSKVIELNSNLPKGYFCRGADSDFTKTIELNPNFAEAYMNRGFYKFSVGLKDSGCLDLSKAGELGISNAYEL